MAPSQVKPKALTFPKKILQPRFSGEKQSRQFHQHSLSNGPSRKQEETSTSPRASQVTTFEADMEQHGLQKKIKDIQMLNSYFQCEIGKNTTGIRGQLPPSTAANPKRGEIKKRSQITFPFQRRARSFSPPKNAKTFKAHSPKDKDEEEKVKPIKGFVCGKQLLNQVNNKRGKSPTTDEETRDRVKNLIALRENISSKNKIYKLDDESRYKKY